MTTIVLANGVRFTGSAQACKKILTDRAKEAERKAQQARERAEHEARLREEEELDARLHRAMWEAEKSPDWDTYSDLHKDLYGVRPTEW